MAEVNASVSPITLNISGLNSPIKRERLTKWFLNDSVYKRLTLNTDKG